MLKKMEEVEIVGLKDTRKTTATDIEMFRKLLESARRVTTCGVCSAAPRRKTSSAEWFWQARFHHPHTHFKAECTSLTKDEGGRHTPFFNNYRPSSTSARRM